MEECTYKIIDLSIKALGFLLAARVAWVAGETLKIRRSEERSRNLSEIKRTLKVMKYGAGLDTIVNCLLGDSKVYGRARKAVSSLYDDWEDKDLVTEAIKSYSLMEVGVEDAQRNTYFEILDELEREAKLRCQK